MIRQLVGYSEFILFLPFFFSEAPSTLKLHHVFHLLTGGTYLTTRIRGLGSSALPRTKSNFGWCRSSSSDGRGPSGPSACGPPRLIEKVEGGLRLTACRRLPSYEPVHYHLLPLSARPHSAVVLLIIPAAAPTRLDPDLLLGSHGNKTNGRGKWYQRRQQFLTHFCLLLFCFFNLCSLFGGPRSRTDLWLVTRPTGTQTRGHGTRFTPAGIPNLRPPAESIQYLKVAEI